MYTTLNKILEYQPCNQVGDKSDGGWQLLLHNVGKTKSDNRKLSFKRILKSNGIKDAVWALRTLNYKQQCMFMHDVAKSTLYIFEKACPEDKRPRQSLEAIVKYKNGEIDRSELMMASASARASAYNYVYNYNYAYASAHASARDSAYASACAYACAYASDSAYVSAYASVGASASAKQWAVIEKLFIKHFC